MADAESKNVTITLSLDSSKFDKSIEKSRKSLDALKDFNVSDSIIKALKDSLNQASELFKNNSNTLNKDIQKIVREYNNTLTSTISKLDEPGKAIVSMLSKTGEEIAKSSSASVSSIVDANIKELKKAYEDLNMALTNHRGYKANIDSREDIHKQLKNEGLLKQAKEEIFKNYGIKDFSDVIKNNNLLKQGIELFNNASEKFKNNILSQTKNYDNAITRKLSNGRQSFSLKNDLNNSVVRTIAHKTIVDKINREIIGSDTYKKAYDEVVKQRTSQWESEYKLLQEQIAKLKDTITNLNNSLRNGTKKEEVADKKADNKEKSSHISDSTEALKQFNSEIRITGEVCFKAVPNILGVANAIRVLTEMCNRFNGGVNTTPPHNYNNGPIQPEWNRAGSLPYTHREDGKFSNNASYKNYGPSEQAFTSLVTRSRSNLFNPEAAKNWVTLANSVSKNMKDYFNALQGLNIPDYDTQLKNKYINERKQRQAKEQQYLHENQAQQKQKYEPLPKEFFSYDNWFKFYKEELALMPHKERYSEIRHAYNLLNSEQIKEARRALYGNARQGNKYETGAYWWARKNAEYEVERWTNWKKQHQDTETNSKTSSNLNNAATNLNNAANKLSDAVNKLNGQTQHNTITGFAQDSTHNNGPKAMFNGHPTKSEYTFGQSSYTTYDHISNNGSKKMPSLEEYLASKGLDKAPIGIGRQEQWLKDIEKAKAEYKAMYEETSKFKGEISKIPFNLQLFASGASDVDKATEAFKKLEQAIKAYTKAQKQYEQAVNDYTNNPTQKLLDQQLLHQEAMNNAYSNLRQAYSAAKTYDKDRANAYMYYELPDANGNKRHPILDNADERKYNNKTIELDIKERYNIDKTIEKLEALRQKIKEVEADGKQMSEGRWMRSSALEQKYMSILNGYGAEQLMSAGYSTSKILSYLNERLYTDERKATHRSLKTQDSKDSLFTKYKELREKYNEIQKIAEVNGKEVSLAKYTSFFYQFKNLTEQMEALGLHTSPLKYSHRNMQSPSEYAQYLNDIGKKSKDEERKYNNKTIELDIKERYNIDKTIEKLEALRQKIKEVEADGKQMSEGRWMRSSALEQKYMSILNGYGAEQLMSAGYSTSKILSYLNERLYTDERKATHRSLKTQDSKDSLFTKYKELREKYNEIQKIAEVNGKEVSLAKYTSFFYQFKNLTEQMEALGLHTSPLKYSHRNMQSPSEYAQYLNDIGKKSKDEERLQTYKQAYDQIISKQQEMLRTGEYLNSRTVEKLTKEANAYANAYNELANLIRSNGMQVDHLKTTPFEAYSANGGYYTVDYYNENTAKKLGRNTMMYIPNNANYLGNEISTFKSQQEANLSAWLSLGQKANLAGFAAASEGITRAQKDFERFNRVLNTTNETWETLMSKMKHHVSWMTSGMFVGAPIMAIQNFVDTIKELEFAMAGIRQVMPEIEHDKNTAINEMGELTAIASKYGESVVGVADAAKSIGRMYGKDENENGEKVEGLGRTNTNIMTAQAAKMAVADAFSLETAFRGLESAMAQWNLQTENTAMLMTNTNRIIETWTIAAHTGAASAQDIANAIEVAGTAAAQAGVSFEFFNALVATGVRQTARSGSEIGTAIKSMMVSMQSADSKKALHEWGIELTEIGTDGVERMRNLEDVILDVSLLLKNTDKDPQGLLKVLAGGRHTCHPIPKGVENKGFNSVKSNFMLPRPSEYCIICSNV